MNRTALAAVCIVSLTTAAISADPPDKQAALHSKQLDVTGAAEHGLSYNSESGVFHAIGNPILHAVLPLKHMTLDAATLDGHFNNKSGVLNDATLTGGVHGTLENKAKKGTNKITFNSSTAVYTDKGTAAADINASGGVNFASSNVTTGSKFSLKGSHGIFHLDTPANQEMSLQNADLDGPVTYSFFGVQLDKDGKSEPSNGSGTAGHLKLTRSGTDYVLYLSGGVTLKGTGGGFGLDLPGTGAVTVIIDESGNFKSFNSDDSASLTLTPIKKSL